MIGNQILLATKLDMKSEHSRFPTITAKELVDEVLQITTKELVEESFGPIRFPKIRVTQIYHDLPIPVAQIDSKLVRIGDKVSEQNFDISRKNVVLQIEGKKKSYQSDKADYLQRPLESIQFTYD